MYFRWRGLRLQPLPTFAQQTNTPDRQLRQRLIDLIKKHGDAINKNDAAAVAALFTEDAVIVEQAGPTFGRKAIDSGIPFPPVRFAVHR